jgi:energy-coupling factor transporter ATP-binding protein EcfA2
MFYSLIVRIPCAAKRPAEGAGASPSKRPVTKKFTVNGAVLPMAKDLYFVLQPDLAQLEAHVEQGTFFMLHGPRGSGKTTTALHLLDHLVRTKGWQDLVVDFNGITTTRTTAEFWTDLSAVLCKQAAFRGIQLASFNSAGTFCAAFSRGALGSSRVVLMLDEFDTLDHAGPGIKEEVGDGHSIAVAPLLVPVQALTLASSLHLQFLGAVRTIKQNMKDYAI